MGSILIVEDDQIQQKRIKSVLESSEYKNSVYCASKVQEAKSILLRCKVDLILLDIELTDGSGLKLAEEIRKMPGYEFVWIVFLSHHKQYMTEAFKKTHCYDYLIKPFTSETILEIVQKLINYKVKKDSDTVKYLLFEQRDICYKISPKDVLFIEVLGKTSTIYTYTHSYTLKKTPLHKIEEMLPINFIRCHKSFLVNRDYISLVRKTERYGWQIEILNSSMEVPVGDRYKNEVMSIFNMPEGMDHADKSN